MAFEILAPLGGTVMDFVGGTIDVFGSLSDIVVDSRNLGLAHPVRPHHPRAKPLRMMDQDMKRRPLDGNARSLEPDAQLSENIVNEALIARVVCQPVHNVAVRMHGDVIVVWRRVHILLLSGRSMVPDVSCPHSTASTESAANCARSGQTAGGTPL